MSVQNPSTSTSREESPLTEYDYSNNVNLWLKLSTDTEWIAILTIPTEEFDPFAIRPLSWLRFLGFAIYGREGVLLLSENGPEVSDYTGSVDSLQGAYYYSSQDDPRLVDLKGINDRVSDLNSNANESHAEFAGAITARDETCVMSGRARFFCDAAHLLPRSKGDEYITFVTEHRKHHDNDVIESINDPRNGLLLHIDYHRLLGRARIAFLKTPNFALNTDDVPRSSSQVSGPGSSARLTLHYFCERDESLVPQNTDARLPHNNSAWPPSIITDFVYACAALKKWGSDDCLSAIFAKTQKQYYPDNASDQGGMSRKLERQMQERKGQEKARRERFEAREEKKSEALTAGNGKTRESSDPSLKGCQELEIGDIMDWVSSLWSKHAKRHEISQELQQRRDESNPRVREWVETQSVLSVS